MRKQLLLEHLEKIVTISSIVKHGSVLSAAAHLNISQPSLSTKIKNLENILGFKVFNRTSKGISLTEKGKYIHDYSKDILRLTEDLSVVLEQNTAEKKLIVRLGIYESVAKYFWSSFYFKFKEAFPHIQIQLLIGRSDKLTDLLLKEDIDAAITISPKKNMKVESDILFSDQFAFFAHKDLLKECTKVNSKVNRCHQVFLFSDAVINDEQTLIELVRKFNLEKSFINHVESFEIAADFCIKKLGISILPLRVAKNLSEYKNLRILDTTASGKNNFFASHDIKLSVLSRNKEKSNIKILCDELKKEISF